MVDFTSSPRVGSRERGKPVAAQHKVTATGVMTSNPAGREGESDR